MLMFAAVFAAGGGLRSRPASRGGVFTLEPDEAAHVVGKIGEADFDPGPRDPDGPDAKTHQTLLVREDMLDGGSNFRFPGVGDPGPFRHGLALGLLAVNA